MLDLRFPTALQVMLSLALAEREGIRSLSSAQLAAGVGVNASFVRKLLVPLAQKGLVASSEGKNGGLRLNRTANTITLREIYGAVTGDKELWIPRQDVPHRCLVSSNVNSFFERLAAEATESVLALLATRTLHDSLVELENIAEASAPNRRRRIARKPELQSKMKPHIPLATTARR
jgi:Rrf2 family transcriptional repressor of oqxAB